MYTMKHRKRAIASGLNVKQDSLTMPSGGTEGGLKVVQVPGSNDFTGKGVFSKHSSKYIVGLDFCFLS